MTRSGNPALDQFFDSVAMALQGTMPEDARDFAISERLDWQEQRIEERVYEGLDHETAIAETLAEDVSPQHVAESILEDYYEREVQSPLLNRFGRGNVVAYAFFSMMTVLYTAFLYLQVFLPSSRGLRIPVDVETIRRFFPAPLPFPDLSWQFLFLVGYPLLAPLVTGWLCAKAIPVRPHTAIYHAFLPVLLLNYLIAAALYPAKEPLLFAISQTLYGLPVGYLTAYTTHKAIRRRQLKPRRTSTLSI